MNWFAGGQPVRGLDPNDRVAAYGDGLFLTSEWAVAIERIAETASCMHTIGHHSLSLMTTVWIEIEIEIAINIQMSLKTYLIPHRQIGIGLWVLNL